MLSLSHPSQQKFPQSVTFPWNLKKHYFAAVFSSQAPRLVWLPYYMAYTISKAYLVLRTKLLSQYFYHVLQW